MFLAALRTIGVFLKMVPWQAYAAVGTALFLWGLYLAIDHRGYERGKVETVADYEARAAETLRLQRKADAIAQAELDKLRAAMVAAQLDHQHELEAAEKKRLAGLAELKGRFAAYVTPLQLSRCSDLPRGFLRFWSDTSAFANGAGDSPAPPTSAISLDAPSGVPLPAVTDTLADQAGAYKACTDRQAGWLKYRADVDAWASAVQRALQGVPP